MSAALLFLSGFAGLVYQVLWMRDLAILFGSSAHAAAVALAVFFGGLAAGAALYARAAARVRNALRVYGALEIGIAASALLFFALLEVYGRLYSPLYQRFADTPALLVTLKALLAAGVLALPTILMGATLPAMVQHAPARPAWLYGVNTFGGTLGAFAAGFFLPPTLGFRGSYLLAVATNVGAGVLALAMARKGASDAPAPAARETSVRRRTPPRARAAAGTADAVLPPAALGLLALASGALTIGLEVVWLRMFAQVLDNSVYAFSAVVVVTLVAFALAAVVVDRFADRAADPAWLAAVLALSAAATALEGPAFVAVTGNLAQLRADGWLEYVLRVFGLAALFAGMPAFAAGLVFPSLLKTARAAANAGAAAGRLVALNTAGAIAGSLGTTFAVLPWLGLWATLALAAVLYAGLAVWLAWTAARQRRAALTFVAAGAAAAALLTLGLPRVRLDDARAERLLGIWESGHGTVAVTEGRDGRVLRMNNSYSLGGTVDRIERERIQAFLPLVLHPSPADVFFLGLGTGITAGEAIRHPAERIVITELIPEVVEASREYFREWTRGLAADPRVAIRAEDGRQYLAATAEAFDVIVSDLFVPWHAGTGTLYTREHFQTVRARLRPGGLFAQWLPLFQLNERDFQVIARTLLDVFPHVVIWRGDFYANRPIVALVASASPMHVDAAAVAARASALAPDVGGDAALAAILPYYAGNLGEAHGLLGGGPINTDGRPLIEYLSPVAQWNSDSGSTPWFVSMPLVRFLAQVRAAAPLDRDPYLALLTERQRGYVEAGALYHRAVVQSLRGDDAAAQADLREALQRLPEDLDVSGPFMALEPIIR